MLHDLKKAIKKITENMYKVRSQLKYLYSVFIKWINLLMYKINVTDRYLKCIEIFECSSQDLTLIQWLIILE